MFPLNSAFPRGAWETLPIKHFLFKNQGSSWQKTSCMTMECLAAVLGPDLWPPTSWEDNSLITDNYYEPDAPQKSGKKYCLWMLNLAVETFMFSGNLPNSLHLSVKKNIQTRFISFMTLSKHSDLHASRVTAAKERDLSPERNWRGSLSESRHDLLVISFDFHVQSKATKLLQFREGRPPRCLFMRTGTCFTGGYQQSQSHCEVKTFGRVPVNTPDISYIMAVWDLALGCWRLGSFFFLTMIKENSGEMFLLVWDNMTEECNL